MKKFLLITLSLVLVISMCSCDFIDGIMDALGLGGEEEVNNLFSDGLLCVKYDGKFGYVDEEGEFVIEPQYDFATPFDGDIAFVVIGEYNYVIDREGNVLETYGEDDEMSPLYYELMYSILLGESLDFVDDIYLYQNAIEEYGYKDADGNVIVEAQFDMALPFQEGVRLAQVKVDGKYGFINELGEFVIEPLYDNADLFCDGLAIVELDDKEAFIDAEGNILSERWYDDIEPFANGYACAERDGQWGYINEEGKWAIQPQFNSAENFTEGGIAVVELDDKFGYIDTDGKYIVSPKYELARDFCEDFAAVRDDGRWTFINVTGERITTYWFDSVGDFNNGAAWVEDDGDYGYIGRGGSYIVSPQFAEAGEFAKNGLAAVLVDEKYGYVNLSGEGVIQPVYDATTGIWSGTSLPTQSHFYDDGFAVGHKDGKYGVINADGVYVIGPRFEGIVTWDNLVEMMIEMN